ncbi:MAG: preprotein translocase subunit SecY [Ruminococcaceae bacterium]|nr:preprotein translocase subunit SecY [Oscillospiraceae bacterium]
MLETIKNAWSIVEIRKKILFTLFIILIFRIGSVMPVPFVDLASLQAAQTNDFFNYLSILTGGGLQYGAIFAMSVTPYINASIILQLLTVAIPYLERLSKEGEEGRKKIAQITRYAAVLLGLVQGTAYFFYLKNSGHLVDSVSGVGAEIFAAVVIIAAFTAGSALVMWLGEQIDVKGIGNGISIILFAGILSRAPDAFASMWNTGFAGDNPKPIPVIAIVLIFLLVIGFVVWMTGAERRIPIQYAKRVVGRKQYGGQNSHIPFKVNMSGVMPIIFASSILMLPTMILSFSKTAGTADAKTWEKVLQLFSYQDLFYAVVYFLLIIGFAYFYAQIQYNPVEIANNIRKNGGSVPGIRPGKPTSDYFAKILSRITLLGALFLSVIAILPILIGNIGGLAELNIALGGTSILIMVGVALDTVQNLESQMMMRHYKGFLD